MIFPELCHACGGCTLACPRNAITEEEREIGAVESGAAGEVRFVRGILNVGEAQASPVIRKVKELAGGGTTIIDCPPGTSCAVIESVKGSDYCVLVTEPTPFGLNDLKLAAEMLGQMGIPHSVVVNRDGLGDANVGEYCSGKGIPILARIPNDRRIAQLYSEGTQFIYELPEYAKQFKGLFNQIICEVSE